MLELTYPALLSSIAYLFRLTSSFLVFLEFFFGFGLFVLSGTSCEPLEISGDLLRHTAIIYSVVHFVQHPALRMGRL